MVGRGQADGSRGSAPHLQRQTGLEASLRILGSSGSFQSFSSRERDEGLQEDAQQDRRPQQGRRLGASGDGSRLSGLRVSEFSFQPFERFVNNE